MKVVVFMVVTFLMVGCQSGNKKENNTGETPAQIVLSEETLNISGMHCNMCVASIEKGVNEVEGVQFVKANLDDSTAVVRFDKNKTNLNEISRAVEKRGYSVIQMQ